MGEETTYQHDGVGNLIQKLDAKNQLTGVQIPGTGSITYPSYTWNRPANITLPGGSTREYTYDPLMRINSITAKDPGQNPLMNYTYTYDRMDNIVSKVTEHGDYVYDYDELYRLTTTDKPTLDDEAFTYDAVGNRLTSSDTTGTWTYNDNNELNDHNDTSYEYDDNGNMTKKTIGGVVTNFIYNAEDRLIEFRDGTDSLVASYYYDPFGRRLWKEVGGVRTYFLYSDEGLVGEYGASGTEIKTYGYKPSSTWTTDPLFMKVGNDYYFYENDHLGTPQKMTGINGAVVWSAKYKAFGEAEVEIFSTITNNLCFPGQYYDDETGLHYNFNRYYDYNLGFFLRIDPIGAQRSTNHIYVYSQSNPINNIDPKGLECTTNAECQTCIVYAEAGGTNETCRKAVAWVIQNRISDTKNTPFLNQHNSCDVASAPGEFDAHGTKRWRDCCNDCLTGLEEKASQEIEKMDLGTDDFMDITFFVDTTRRKFTPSWIEKRINNGRMSQVYIGGCTSFRFYKIE